MKPAIGITSGDPAGIGLEVALKAVPKFLSEVRCVLFTDPPHFERCRSLLGIESIPTRWISISREITDESLLFLVNVSGSDKVIPWGEASLRAGERAAAYLAAASDEALVGHIQAIVTGPVSKASIGGDFKGQTEFLAQRAAVRKFAMAFFTPSFKVVLATVHMSLKEALSSITEERYVDLISFVDREFLRLGYNHPRIAVAGINPHAGEGGMFGREEIEILEPAVQIAAAKGVLVSGPHSADSLYYRAHTGEFDVVIAPYHDQGLAPVKLIAHGISTNVTLGLPYIRTSPDHGTAFQIAGRNVADPGGMISAIQCAIELVERQSRQTP